MEAKILDLGALDSSFKCFPDTRGLRAVIIREYPLRITAMREHNAQSIPGQWRCSPLAIFRCVKKKLLCAQVYVAPLQRK